MPEASQIEIAPVNVVEPGAQVVEKQPVTPMERLRKLVDDKTTTTDQIFDFMENEFIPQTEKINPEDNHYNVDLGILLINDIPNRMISDQDFSKKVNTISSIDDPRIDNLPEFIKPGVKAGLGGQWGEPQLFLRLPEDPKWIEYWKLVERYTWREIEIFKNSPELIKNYLGYLGANVDDEYKIENFTRNRLDNLGTGYKVNIDRIKEKSLENQLVASGEWLGSGTFISNVEKMLETGGKMKSAYHVLNSGGKMEDMGTERGINSGEIDSVGIFFFHWKNNDERYGRGLETVGHYGMQGGEGGIHLTDVSVFYPIDTVVRHDVSIVSRGNTSTAEFIATKSPDVYMGNRALNSEEIAKYARNDQTELPLSEAFLRVNNEGEYKKLIDLFTKFGYEEEWTKNHIYHEKIGESPDEFKKWLETRSYAKVPIISAIPRGVGNHYLWEINKEVKTNA